MRGVFATLSTDQHVNGTNVRRGAQKGLDEDSTQEASSTGEEYSFVRVEFADSLAITVEVLVKGSHHTLGQRRLCGNGRAEVSSVVVGGHLATSSLGFQRMIMNLKN